MLYLNREPAFQNFLRQTVRPMVKSVALDSEFTNIFDDLFSIDDFVAQIAFAWLKDVLTDCFPRQSVSAFIPKTEVDFDRIQARIYETRKLLLERNKSDLERLGVSSNPYATKWNEKESGGAGQFEVYTYSKTDYLSLENSARNKGLPIVALFKDGMIADSKRSAGDRIESAYRNYGEYLLRQAQAPDSTEWIHNLFDVASLETNSGVSFVYALAEYMDKNSINTLPEHVKLLCSKVNITESLQVESRFLMKRNVLIPFVCESPLETAINRFAPLLTLHVQMYRQLHCLKQSADVLKYFDIDDIADYFRKHYNLFDIYQFSHDFSAKFIKHIRGAFRTLFVEEK